jgi:cell division protein FtsB
MGKRSNAICNSLLAERDATIADLQRDVEQLTASNAEADATIEALRAQVAELGGADR